MAIAIALQCLKHYFPGCRRLVFEENTGDLYRSIFR